MSEPVRKPERETGHNHNLPARYEVGYGKPPIEHRFTKGQSGNPNGRPKGSKNQPKITTGNGMRAAEEFLRHEAYRPVMIREGERVVELPAIQAVFRAMGVAAMKGNRFAQKTMAELVTDLERRDAEARFELFSTTLEYKQRWSDEIKRCELAGLPIPEPIPHPDDIIIDPRNGGVRVEGPQTEEEKAHYDKALKRRQEAQDEVSLCAEKYRRSRSEKHKAMWLEEWHWEQRMFDIINDSLVPRYKAKLKDRSYREGASREGETLKAFIEDRKKRPDDRRWGDYVDR